jgi:ankyrin repeat protein
MSARELPARPNLEHLKNQAHALLRERRAVNPSENFKLADALHQVANDYGFPTWPALKFHVEATSEDPQAAFAAAIRSEKASLVRSVLARYPELRATINEPSPAASFGAPALFLAVHRENREVIDALLEAGANINQRSHWWAGSFGVLDSASLELSAFLISRGAVLDIHAAARLGMIDKLREMLARDPQLVHARGGDGQLPLHFASNVDIAKLLLDHGADVNARDIDHESTAAQYMVSCHPARLDVARFLIANGAQTDILMACAVGDLPLVERIVNNDPETIRFTASERSFPKQNPESGGCIYIFCFGITKTPHIIAHQFGYTAIFEFLMQRSAPWLRLSQAAEIGDEARVDEIMRNHPGLFTRLSPLAARRILGAAVRSNARAVELLLQRGWPADATLENKQTALHFAAWHGNLAMVRALVAHGAPINVFEAEHGGSPLAWALHGSLHSWLRDKGDYPGVTQALLTAGAQIPQPDRPLEASDEVLEVLRAHAPA